PDTAGADAPSVAAAESDAPLSPQPEKMSALPARVRSARFFIIFRSVTQSVDVFEEPLESLNFQV
ncbi:MAG: hypothetical protein ACI8ZW_002236, partial [Yoonia sp.]